MNLSELKNFNLNNLDFQNIGSWPLSARIVAIVLMSLVVLGAGIWVDTRGQMAELDAAKAKEAELKQSFELKQAKVANLVAYKQQMVDMERTFGALLRQLPSKTEVAGLIDDVSSAGVVNGLKFELFEPQPEVQKDFYAEYPIKISLSGSYHDLGRFVSDVAALPRIVSLHDFSLTTRKDTAGGVLMEATAKTYRYMDEDEIAAAEASKKAAALPAGAAK